ncbi:hypothetical protein PG994_008138 [Apiospora phragmitis]|uniref:Uncharacterized protein n=1 Tax=Apiospora phragmitis TaxID=2905665 RepID=A0ABR1US66_9PEZI
MADSSDKKVEHATRTAAPSGSRTTAAAPTPKPLTSGDLKYRPMRLYQKRQRANGMVQQQLKETAFGLLNDENSKRLILRPIDQCLSDDM